ncbi:MAG: hypothetical protein JXN65_10375 [Clostridia bacterium]|nr:hypothetical protein [Clostridia bacterium]
METLTKLFDEYKNTYFSLLILFIVEFTIFIGLYSILIELPKIFSYILILSLLALFLWYLGNVLKYNTLPKSKKGSLSILLYINSQTKKQYDELRKLLGERFETLIRNKTEIDFIVLYVPFHLTNKDALVDLKSKVEILKKTNAKYLITIKIVSNNSNTNEKYLLELNMGINHKKYNAQLTKLYEASLNEGYFRPFRITFTNDEKLEIMLNTADKINYICQYVLGVTCMLDGQIDIAKKVCDSLYNDLYNAKAKDEVKSSIGKLIPLRCAEIYMNLAIRSLHNYYDKKDITSLNDFYTNLSKMNTYKPNSFDYYLNMAIYHFLKRRDITKAQHCINKSLELKPKNTALYSNAFLTAYQAFPCSKIYKAYKRAFHVNYDLQSIIKFINMVLEDEPKQSGLYFALAILHAKCNDENECNKSMIEYLNLNKHLCTDFVSNEIIKALTNKEIKDFITC